MRAVIGAKLPALAATVAIGISQRLENSASGTKYCFGEVASVEPIKLWTQRDLLTWAGAKG
jgi:hypothetical protein